MNKIILLILFISGFSKSIYPSNVYISSYASKISAEDALVNLTYRVTEPSYDIMNDDKYSFSIRSNNKSFNYNLEIVIIKKENFILDLYNEYWNDFEELNFNFLIKHKIYNRGDLTDVYESYNDLKIEEVSFGLYLATLSSDDRSIPTVYFAFTYFDNELNTILPRVFDQHEEFNRSSLTIVKLAILTGESIYELKKKANDINLPDRHYTSSDNGSLMVTNYTAIIIKLGKRILYKANNEVKDINSGYTTKYNIYFSSDLNVNNLVINHIYINTVPDDAYEYRFNDVYSLHNEREFLYVYEVSNGYVGILMKNYDFANL